MQHAIFKPFLCVSECTIPVIGVMVNKQFLHDFDMLVQLSTMIREGGQADQHDRFCECAYTSPCRQADHATPRPLMYFVFQIVVNVDQAWEALIYAPPPPAGGWLLELLTWQPTPMNRRRLQSRASTVARVLRLGLRVGFTPRALMMSSLHRATSCTQTPDFREA